MARRLLLVASIGLLVVGNPLPEAMVPPGPMMLQGAAADDQSARSERSANLSHITGTARKIRMYVKNRYLQLMPDGQVNGTNDQLSDYTILQRSSINSKGQLKIQGVASCMHLCMDACGLLYGSREFNDECVFNEVMEQNSYNTYSSAKYSNQRRTQYLALNKKGQPRRVLIKAKTPLGKLSTYTRVLTQHLPPSSVDQKPHTCPPPPQPQSGSDLESPRCKRRRKKKKRRRCPENSRRPCKIDEDNASNEEGDGSVEDGAKKTVVFRRKCEEENCRTKKLHMIGRKRKSRHGAGANTGLIHGQLQHPHDGQHHTIKRTRHLHHIRHVHQPPPDEDDEVPEHDHDFDDHELDNDDHNNNNNLITTIDPNNDDLIDDFTTDQQQLLQLLDTNDK